ncbi:MAG: HNH endonuclease [Candidatus Eisenbacteria bacterium]
MKKLPKKFVDKCRSVTAKRPRTVIEHIRKHGHVTTQELKDMYGYNHPPRAARDVREQGIPLETFRVVGSDGRKIGAYRFGDPRNARFSRLHGRTALSKELKARLIRRDGCRCAIYLEEFPERELQIDHRIPFEVAGDDSETEADPSDFMLISGSANRAKSWSCEHCVNWLELKKKTICRKCYWAYPERYKHVAMRPVRRLDILWTAEDVQVYDELKRRTEALQTDMPSYVKDIVRKHVLD